MTPAFTVSTPFTRFFSLLAVFSLVGLAACSSPAAGNPDAGVPADDAAVGASSGQPPAALDAAMFTGEVVETMNSGGYTYARLRSGEDDVWVASTEIPVEEGQTLTVSLDMPMEDFHSPTLDRDFPLLYFASQISREGQSASAPFQAPGVPGLTSSHEPTTPAGAAQVAASSVQPNAPPAGGLSIADTWAQRASLAGKQVTVRGTVVKVNNGILGSNWFHLQDGSGSAADGTHDLTVTSSAVVSVGDVVTVSGTLAIQKDFGAGYSYEAILENATIR